MSERAGTGRGFGLGGGEPLLTLTEAAKRLPGSRGAERVHPATLTRWILKGVRGVAGDCVRLEGVRVGSRWLIPAGALERFSAALAASPENATAVRTPGERERAAERAERELIRLGA